MIRRLSSSSLLVVFLLYPAVTHAQWQLDGTPLSIAAGTQSSATITSDGSGGAIVTWSDFRSNGNGDIYAQRINAAGAAQWTADGVALCTVAGCYRSSPLIVSDGAGGAIVAWTDNRNGSFDVYAQRINAAGAVQWTIDGVAVCTAPLDQGSAAIATDGSGGAIVTWTDDRSVSFDVYAQRINSAGAAQWTADGVALCTAAQAQYIPTIVPDGAGGAIVTWLDDRNTFDIYAQRINAAGAVQWTADGVALCNAAHQQRNPKSAPDGAGGAIVIWDDLRSGTNWDTYAQRINAAGAVQWTANGVPLCTAVSDQDSSTIVADGAGGAIVTWYDSRSANYNIYAQRINASGALQWAADGVALCTAANEQSFPRIVPDGAGGAIVTWQDSRGVNYDIYAQRINASGVVQWTTNGVALCTAANEQSFPTIVPDGAGGAIVTWTDSRSGSFDVYVQRVEGTYGYWYALPWLVSVADVPGDQGGRVKVNWTASAWDTPILRIITHYSVWRATDAAAAAAAHGVAVRGLSEIPGNFEGKAVRTQHASGADFYWEWLANIDAHYFSAYSYTAATRSDSTGVNSFDESYLVSAHTGDDFVFFDSNVVSGHSLDNLAPASPLYLTAKRVAADVHLTWNGVHISDLKNYSVYRATSSGVTPIPTNFLATDTDTVLVDASAPTSDLYYIVTATDVHGNEGKASNEASVSAMTNAGNLPPVTALTVLQNHPNPFTGQTELEIGLPAAGPIHLEVFDVAGRRVREETVSGVQGWQRVPFSGLDGHGDGLVSGVYLCKVSAMGATVTRKMVIVR